MRILAKHKRLLTLHDCIRRVGVLNNDDLGVLRQRFKVRVKLIFKVSTGQIIFCSIWLSVCQQWRIEYNESRVWCVALTAESKQPEGESCMRNGAKALTKSTTRLSSNYKISRLGIEVHIPNLWEVPTSQYAFNSLSKTMGHSA